MAAARTETFKLIDSGYGERRESLTVTVEYVEVPHMYESIGQAEHEGRPMKAYEVMLDGEKVGKIEHVVESTDRHYGRIRSPGRGRLAWGWVVTGPPGGGIMPRYNSPGLYRRTRRDAVADMLGWSYAGEA
jgi:hypothetical protein